jgi:hypothetical protein
MLTVPACRPLRSSIATDAHRLCGKDGERFSAMADSKSRSIHWSGDGLPASIDRTRDSAFFRTRGHIGDQSIEATQLALRSTPVASEGSTLYAGSSEGSMYQVHTHTPDRDNP